MPKRKRKEKKDPNPKPAKKQKTGTDYHNLEKSLLSSYEKSSWKTALEIKCALHGSRDVYRSVLVRGSFFLHDCGIIIQTAWTIPSPGKKEQYFTWEDDKRIGKLNSRSKKLRNCLNEKKVRMMMLFSGAERVSMSTNPGGFRKDDFLTYHHSGKTYDISVSCVYLNKHTSEFIPRLVDGEGMLPGRKSSFNAQRINTRFTNGLPACCANNLKKKKKGPTGYFARSTPAFQVNRVLMGMHRPYSYK